MESSGPFGMDPDDFERVVRETGEGLRDAFEKANRFLNASPERGAFGMLFDQFVGPGARATARPRPQPETAGEAGDGVWAIFISDAAGKAHVEQVYKTEIDALRANRLNTDPSRNVRFLPYGIDISVLDAGVGEPEADDDGYPDGS